MRRLPKDLKLSLVMNESILLQRKDEVVNSVEQEEVYIEDTKIQYIEWDEFLKAKVKDTKKYIHLKSFL